MPQTQNKISSKKAISLSDNYSLPPLAKQKKKKKRNTLGLLYRGQIQGSSFIIDTKKLVPITSKCHTTTVNDRKT
jgi:hypothetical protein